MSPHGQQISALAATWPREAAQKYKRLWVKLTPIACTSVADSGVLLTIRYPTEPRRRQSTAQAIWEDFLDAFARHDDIDFAYPTTRFYRNADEGKPGTRPAAAGPAPPRPTDDPP